MSVQKVFRAIRDYAGTVTFQTDDRTTTGETAAHNPGEPMQTYLTGSPYAVCINTAGPVVGSDEFLGLARKKSTETSSANGEVEIIGAIPGLTVLRGYATTSTNIDTQSELNAILGEWVYADITARTGTNGDFTFDENEAQTEPNKGTFKIIDGDAVAKLDCLVHVNATVAGCLTGQTMD